MLIKNEITVENVAFPMVIVVEARGVEPLSENASTRTSPGAVGYCGRLALPVPITKGKPTRLLIR